MRNLIAANFYRMRRSKAFLIELIAMSLLGIAESVIGAVQHRIHLSFGTSVCLDSIFYGYALFIGFFVSIFCSLFIGTEYSDGTLRNKIVFGYLRGSIYFANLMTVIVAALAMGAAYLVPVTVIGGPLMGALTQSTGMLLLKLLGTIILMISFSSFFTMMSILVSDKTVVAVIGLLFTSFFSVIAFMLNDYSNWMREGSGVSYLICMFVHSFLPMGQAIQYADVDYNALSADRIPPMILYSLLLSVFTTAIGYQGFLKKSVK